MSGRKITQRSNNHFKFPCGHEGILPEVGCRNLFVRWHKLNRGLRRGYWTCRLCDKNYRLGVGSLGLFSWARIMINSIKWNARAGGYKAAEITSEELITLRLNTAYCSDGCGAKLKWCTDGSFKNPHLHHDHETGEVYGFVTRTCNSVEGLFTKIGDNNPSLQRKWLEYHFPRVTRIFNE